MQPQFAGRIFVAAATDIHYGAAMQNRVRQWREGRSLTQPELARAIGVAQSTIGRIEKGNGCHSDTAYVLLEFAGGALSLWDLVSDAARRRLANRRLEARTEGARI